MELQFSTALNRLLTCSLLVFSLTQISLSTYPSIQGYSGYLGSAFQETQPITHTILI